VKYLCLAYYDPAATDALPRAELADIVKQCPPHDEALRASGHLVLQASLGEPSATRVIKPRRSRKVHVTDGPFTESKELVGGFFIIEAADIDEAARIGSLHPAANVGEEIGWGVEIWPIDRLVRYDGTRP
jgi:hypothetical protein